MLSYMAEALGLMRNNVRRVSGSGAPALLFGARDLGIGSEYIDYATGNTYINIGTLAAPVWILNSGLSGLRQASGTITPAQIISVAAGDFGHASGVTLVSAVGAGNVCELVSVVTMYDFLTAAYTAGGNTTVNNIAGGAALTGLVSAANSFGAAADNSDMFVPLSTAALPLVVNGGLSLVSSAAFTNPGTAAGSIRWTVNYRVHATGF